MGDRIGQQLGNYRLTQVLGRGGFAEVYLGEHIYLKTLTAIKVLQTRLSGSEDMSSFLKEAQMIARLSHPCIVRVMDFGIDNETPFLVMDYAPNGTLRQRHPKGSRLPLSTIVPYVKQLADALHYAHSEKLIHRDIKPENLLIGRRNELLLSDFGIALIAQSSRYQSTQDVVGTVTYMSPEQIQGKPRPASDQYSLAVVIYEWLCGDRPFHGSFTELCTQHIFASPPPLREKVPEISSDVERVIMTALAKDPKERFGNIQAFANALEQASQQPAPQKEIVANESPLTQTSHPKPLFDDIQSPPPPRPTTGKPSAQQSGGFSPVRDSDIIQESQPYSQSYPPQTKPLLEEETDLQRPPARRRFLPDNPIIEGDSLGNTHINRKPIPAPSLKRTWLFVAVAVLLVISGLGIFDGVSVHMANVAATATADAEATASAAQANATSTAQAVAAEQVYTRATGGTPATDDPLSDDRNHWGLLNTSWGGTCAFTGGAYHLALSNPGYWIWCNCANLANFNNFALQVQMSIAKGDDGGIVFGMAPNSYYRIYIDSAGTYTLYQYTKSNNQTQTLSSGSSSAISTGLNQVNAITMIVNNSNFYLFANGQFVSSAYLSAYTQGGAGLTAESLNQSTDVAFSNLKAWTF